MNSPPALVVINSKYDLNIYCRTCSKQTGFVSLFKSIPTSDGSFVMISTMIEICTKIKVEQGDGYPLAICIECLQELKESYTFAKKCMAAQDKLKRFLFKDKKDSSKIYKPEPQQTVIPQKRKINIKSAVVIPNKKARILQTSNIPNTTSTSKICTIPKGEGPLILTRVSSSTIKNNPLFTIGRKSDETEKTSHMTRSAIMKRNILINKALCNTTNTPSVGIKSYVPSSSVPLQYTINNEQKSDSCYEKIPLELLEHNYSSLPTYSTPEVVPVPSVLKSILKNDNKLDKNKSKLYFIPVLQKDKTLSQTNVRSETCSTLIFSEAEINDLISTVEEKSNGKPVKCPIGQCKIQFSTGRFLKKHLLDSHIFVVKHNLTCKYCPLTFLRHDEYLEHLTAHTRESLDEIDSNSMNSLRQLIDQDIKNVLEENKKPPEKIYIVIKPLTQDQNKQSTDQSNDSVVLQKVALKNAPIIELDTKQVNNSPVTSSRRLTKSINMDSDDCIIHSEITNENNEVPLSPCLQVKSATDVTQEIELKSEVFVSPSNVTNITQEIEIDSAVSTRDSSDGIKNNLFTIDSDSDEDEIITIEDDPEEIKYVKNEQHKEVTVIPPLIKIIRTERQISPLPELKLAETVLCKLCNQNIKKIVFYYHEAAHKYANEISCSECTLRFTTLLSYCDHMKTIHDETKEFKCFLVGCRTDFPTYDLLVKHRLVHRDIQCEFCLNVVKGYVEYKNHVKEYHLHEGGDSIGTKKKKCQYCNKEVTIGSMRAHIKTKHTAERFFCNLCPKRFHYPYYLKLHVNSVHRRLYKEMCDICGKRFLSTTLKNHKRKYHEVYEKEQCHLCEKKFTTKSGLQRHVERCHDAKKNFYCETCGRGFYDNVSLKRHKLIESGIKVKCTYCHKLYSSDKNLKSHMRTHSLPVLPCRFCDKTFTSPINFNIHIKMHVKNMRQIQNEKDREILLNEYLVDTSNYKSKKKKKKKVELTENQTAVREILQDVNETSKDGNNLQIYEDSTISSFMESSDSGSQQAGENSLGII